MVQGDTFALAHRPWAVRLLCCFVAWGWQGYSASAQNRVWAPIPVDTDWMNAENWIPAGVPTSAETALISHNGIYDVALSESQTIGSFTLGGTQGLQKLTLNNGTELTLQNGEVQGTGALVLNDAHIMGSIANHASIRLQRGALSALTVNSGLLEAVDSENSIGARPIVNPAPATIRVVADSAPTTLIYGNPAQPLPLGNAGRIEVITSSGLPATFDLVGGNLIVLDTGVVTLSGDAGAAVLDVNSVTNAGFLSGQGVVTGNLHNDARVRVGASPGTLAIGGAFSQSATASLEFEIAGAAAGSEYSVLDVVASADLSGQLIVDFLDDYQPADTDDFTIVHRAGGSGEFETIQVSGLSEHGYSIRYEDDAVVMNFTSGDDVLAGDFNGNLQVEQADLDLVLLNWGFQGRTPIGWINDLPDGAIDQNELDRVLLNWGNTSMPPLAAAGGVPEPASCVLLLVAALAAVTLRYARNT